LENLGERRKGILWGFSGFGRPRDFRDDGDGEADRPAGPRHAQDSRCDGRQRRWGGTQWAASRVRAVPAGFAARAPRVREEGRMTGVSKGNKCAQRESFENTRDLVGVLL
jgi:hypothetical protein